jgi:predicted membrane protein
MKTLTLLTLLLAITTLYFIYYSIKQTIINHKNSINSMKNEDEKQINHKPKKFKIVKKLTKFENKLIKLEAWLQRNYGVSRFNDLKFNGQKLTDVRRKALTAAGFVNFKA